MKLRGTHGIPDVSKCREPKGVAGTRGRGLDDIDMIRVARHLETCRLCGMELEASAAIEAPPANRGRPA